MDLVRYLHLNPLRAGLVADLPELAAYPYSGHAALLGTQAYSWQATEEVLGRFSPNKRSARRQYQRFVKEGVAHGRRPELQGGGLIRSAGCWAAVQELRRGREGYSGDERILGSSEFVEQIRQEAEAQAPLISARQQALPAEELIARVCEDIGISHEELHGPGRRTAVSRARAGIAYLWIERLGQQEPALARVLGLRPPTIYEAARRGQQEAAYWNLLITEKA